MTNSDEDMHQDHVRTLMGLFTLAGFACWHPHKRAEWKEAEGQQAGFSTCNMKTSLQYIYGAFDFEAQRPGSKIIYVRLQDYNGETFELAPAMTAVADVELLSEQSVRLVVGRQTWNQYRVFYWNPGHGWRMIGESYKEGAHWKLDLETILYIIGAIPPPLKQEGQARLPPGAPS